jgi:hypothetical protein
MELVSGSNWKERWPQPGSLADRSLRLTAMFETRRRLDDACSVVAGDFDRMGISFGCLQWNIGQGTLQLILRRFLSLYPEYESGPFEESFKLTQRLLKAGSVRLQLRSLRENHHGTVSTHSHLMSMLRYWGTTIGMVRLQYEAARELFVMSERVRKSLGLATDRAVTLLFDIQVQNGRLSSKERRVVADLQSRGHPEPETLETLVPVVASRANPEYAADVSARKMTIVRREGEVHRRQYDLRSTYMLF